MNERTTWKRKARGVIKKRYWAYLAVCFFLSFLGSEYSTSSLIFHQYDSSYEISQEVMQPSKHQHNLGIVFGEVNEHMDQMISLVTHQESYLFKFVGALENLFATKYQAALALFSACCLEFAYMIFLSGPLLVGSRKFYLSATKKQDPPIRTILGGFQKGVYLRNGWTLFLKNFYLLLWTPTIVMPFVKLYEYRLIPYLLAEDVNLTRKEAFQKSAAWMHGNKKKLLLLDLSYTGWFLLNILTLGLVGIFYSNPYHAAAVTEFYLDVKKKKATEE